MLIAEPAAAAVVVSMLGSTNVPAALRTDAAGRLFLIDRKSTRLNSSHVRISYAVFCLKKKKPRDSLLYRVFYLHLRICRTCFFPILYKLFFAFSAPDLDLSGFGLLSIFFFNDTATTEIYTLSLHDALPISHRGAGRRGRRRLDARLDERPRGITNRRRGEVVLDGVGQLDVAEGAGRVLDLAGHALVPLAAEPHGPVHGGSAADLLVPLLADLREVIDPDVRGAAAIGPVHHQDRLVRQRDARVHRGDLRVVPLRDPAQEDVGQDVRCEAELRVAWQVVRRHDGAEDRRDMQEVAGRPSELVVGHRAVGRAEVHGACGDLPDPAAATDGLIVEAGTLIDLRVLVEPLRVDRIREGRAGAVHQHLRGDRLDARAEYGE